MPKLKLSYFDFHGGRAEPIRLALAIGGIAFEDHRFTFPEFAEVRKTVPFGQVPVMHVDQALLCDEVAYVVEEAGVKLGPSFSMKGDEQKAARVALVNSSMPVYLGWLQNQLLAHGGQYFADNRLTVADLKVFVDVRGLNSGRLDHVPTDLVEKVAPALNAHMQRIAQTPAVVAYYAKFGSK